MRVDLHMHTGYSADADFPQTIDDKIAACERAGLDIIGLTDHLDFFRRRPPEENRDAENALIVVRVFAYGFITLMSLICVANVFNTTTTNVLLRRRDFAMLRSAGMTRGGLNRMICYECLLYGTRALLIGLPLSVALAFLMYRSASFIGASYFRLDWTAVIIASVMVFLVVFLSMMYAMRKIKRDNPVDALKNETT